MSAPFQVPAPTASATQSVVSERIETAAQCLADAQWAVGYLASKAALSPEWALEMSRMGSTLARMTRTLAELESELTKQESAHV